MHRVCCSCSDDYPELYPGYGQLDSRKEYFDFVHFSQYVRQMFVQFHIKSLDREI